MDRSASGARGSEIEALRSWLTRRSGDWLGLLKTLVGIGSHSEDARGVERVGAEVAARLQPNEFDFVTVPQPPVAPDRRWLAEVLAPGVPYKSLAGTMVARRDGKGDGVLLLGDLDTAFPAVDLPIGFEIVDGRAFGPGVADAKGGLVVMVASLLALDALGLPTPPIRIVLSGDEQAGSLGSRAVIRAEASACRTCFCLECARGGGKLMAARAHIGVGRVDATGRASHAGTAHATGVNAIDALVALLPRLTGFSDPEAHVFVSATKIEGGQRRSVIPARASAILDVRTPDAAAWDTLAARLHEETKKANLGSAAALELRLEAHRPGVSWSRTTSTLLKLVQEAASGIGLELEATTSSAAGSSAFAAESGAVVIDGMGPSGGDLMTPDEFVDVDSLVPRAAVLAESMRRLALEGLSDPIDGDGAR